MWPFFPGGGGGGGGVLTGNLGGGVQIASLFQTKICDFPYPISDLTQNSILYFRPTIINANRTPEEEN